MPLALTSPPKRAKKGGSGCGCMLAPSKVLAKVSPSGRLASRDKDLNKPSPDRQRLIAAHHNSSDEQHAAASADSSAAAGGSAGHSGPEMDSLHYFGVFDGHGGADAARHCAQRMHQVGCRCG